MLVYLIQSTTGVFYMLLITAVTLISLHDAIKNVLHRVCSTTTLTFSKSKVTGTAIPLQPWTGPEGSRRLRLPDFKAIGT
jgi:hypothetical protein